MSHKSSVTRDPREVELLLQCARVHTDDAGKERILHLVHEGIDWRSLQRVARWHGVMPLLYQNLIAAGESAVPQTIRADLKRQYVVNTGHNLSLTRELLQLLRQFRSEKVRTLPYKGPMLAATVYRNMALRQFSDLDLLVDQGDFHKAADLLASLGYRRRRGWDWEWNLVDAGGTISVDLHRGLLPRQLRFPLDFDGLWERSAPASVMGHTLSNLSMEDLLLVLCVQVAKDGWEKKYKLSKICDINELLRGQPDLDWAQLVTRCEKLDSRRILYFGLAMTHEFFGTPLPVGPLKYESLDRDIVDLATKVRKEFFSAAPSQMPGWGERAAFHAKLRESHVSRMSFGVYIVAHFAHLVFVPNEFDRDFVSLPASLSFLYFIVKPVRLLRKYSAHFMSKRAA